MSYNELREKFMNTYKVNLDLTKLENKAKKDALVTQGLNALILNESTKDNSLSVYTKTLLNALEECVETTTQMTRTDDYGLKGFKLTQFVKDFDDLLAAKKAENGEPHTPFMGASYKKLLDYVVTNSQNLNNKLSTIWTKRVLGDKMNVDEMKKITDASIKNLASVKDTKNLDKDAMHSLETIIAAKHAMTQVRAKRGVFFKIFSFRINGREKEYLTELTKKIDFYAVKNYPVSQAIMNTSNPVLKDAYWDVEVYKNPELAKLDKIKGNNVNAEQERLNIIEANAPKTDVVKPVESAKNIVPPTINKN